MTLHDGVRGETPGLDDGNGEMYDNSEDADIEGMTQQYELVRLSFISLLILT